MPILNNIKRIFGFGDDGLEDSETDMEHSQPQSADAQPAILPAAEPPVPDSDKVRQIFNGVVEVFNRALPTFISGAVDPEKQTQQLYDSLDDSLKAYLAQVEAQVTEFCHAEWEQEKKRLEDEAATLRQKAKDLEDKRAALNDQKLSAERQKRALSDRVRDLEQEVQRLEAEKEQLDIENKCMINKTKAAAVMESELEELRAIASERKDDQSTEPMPTTPEAQAEIEKLQAQLKEKEATIAEKDAAIAEKDAAIAEKDGLIADKEAKITEKDALIAERDASIADRDSQLAEKDKAIAEQQDTQSEIEEIKQQVEKFEEVRSKMDARYEKMKQTLSGVQTENESLRQTIRNNLLQNADEQKRLRQRIADLENELERKEAAEGEKISIAASPEEPYQHTVERQKPPRKRKRVQAEANDLDDMVAGTDWLVATPAEDVSMRPTEKNPDFGYQPPQRKTKPAVPDAQMSLFDF